MHPLKRLRVRGGFREAGIVSAIAGLSLTRTYARSDLADRHSEHAEDTNLFRVRLAPTSALDQSTRDRQYFLVRGKTIPQNRQSDRFGMGQDRRLWLAFLNVLRRNHESQQYLSRRQWPRRMLADRIFLASTVRMTAIDLDQPILLRIQFAERIPAGLAQQNSLRQPASA